MACPRCRSSRYIKDGKINGRQRYECKQCQYHDTVERRSNERPAETRQLALDMYLEGLGFSRHWNYLFSRLKTSHFLSVKKRVALDVA